MDGASAAAVSGRRHLDGRNGRIDVRACVISLPRSPARTFMRARARIHTAHTHSHTHIHAHSFFPSSSLFLLFCFLCFFSFFSSSLFPFFYFLSTLRKRAATTCAPVIILEVNPCTHTHTYGTRREDDDGSPEQRRAYLSQRDAATTTFPQSHGMQHRNLARYRILIYLTWPRARTHAHARIHTYTRGRQNRDVRPTTSSPDAPRRPAATYR